MRNPKRMKLKHTFLPGCLALAAATASAEPLTVPLDLFSTMNDLEVTLWAQTPMFHNPTNIDVDRDGRIWVAEGVNYRRHYGRNADGDRIMVGQVLKIPRS